MALSRELPHSFREAIAMARQILSANHDLVAKNLIDTEAEQLVVAAYRHATGTMLSRLQLFSRLQDRFPDASGEKLLIMAMGRTEGKPLQHLTGFQTFLEHEYDVGPDVLVPRPETELLVVTAIEHLEARGRVPAFGIEIGLGSGAIATELLWRFSKLRMAATELVLAAEKRARSNADRILGSGPDGSERLKIFRPQAPLEVWEPLLGFHGRGADFIISNPPYMIHSDPIEADVLAHEPKTALYAPEADPVHFYRKIEEGAAVFLAPDGMVFLEIPIERSQTIEKLFAKPEWQVKVLRDLTNRDRIVVAQRT